MRSCAGRQRRDNEVDLWAIELCRPPARPFDGERAGSTDAPGGEMAPSIEASPRVDCLWDRAGPPGDDRRADAPRANQFCNWIGEGADRPQPFGDRGILWTRRRRDLFASGGEGIRLRLSRARASNGAFAFSVPRYL